MAADEFIYRLFRKCMAILKLVQRSELLHVETVWQNDV